MSQPTTLGALRDTGYRSRSVKTEIRENLLARLRSGETAFPGIVGFDDTVLPQLESALLAGHDLVLLGERGQGKTRLMRTDRRAARRVDPRRRRLRDQRRPARARCARAAAGLAADRATTCRSRGGTAASGTSRSSPPPTPASATSSGDVDPVKVAEGRTLGDPETVHYGLLPRTNRGIFGINELPDLAERIQVAMFNVLEERDIQVRGYSLRLPSTYSSWPARTPRTTPTAAGSSPRSRTASARRSAPTTPTRSTRRSRWSPRRPSLVADVPEHLLEVVARLTRGLRESPAVDHRSGVSARFAIAAAEGVAASALRRGARAGEGLAVARVCDVPAVVPTLLGKIEFEMGEEGREAEVVQHLLRVAVAETFRERLDGLDLSGFTDLFAEGATVETGELVPAEELLGQVGTVPGLSKVLDRLGHGDDASPGRGRGRDRARARGAAPDPPHRQGVRGRPVGLRGLRPCRRFRYGPWHDGPDPLAPPYDVRAALDEVGRDVLAGGSMREALSDLLRRGFDGNRGLDDLAARVRRMRNAARRRGDLGGTLDQVRAALDQALAQERDTLARGGRRGARGPRWSWRPCPTTWPARCGRWRPTTGTPTRRARPTSRSSRCCSARCSTRSSPG